MIDIWNLYLYALPHYIHMHWNRMPHAKWRIRSRKYGSLSCPLTLVERGLSKYVRQCVLVCVRACVCSSVDPVSRYIMSTTPPIVLYQSFRNLFSSSVRMCLWYGYNPEINFVTFSKLWTYYKCYGNGYTVGIMWAQHSHYRLFFVILGCACSWI